MKLLIITDNRFWRQSLGSHQRIFKLISYLKQFAEVTIYYIGKPTVEDKLLIKQLSLTIIISADLTKHTFSISDLFNFLLSRMKLAVKKLKKYFYWWQ